MYEHGCFRCILNFPSDYPHSPPSMYFSPPIWHPNVHEDGKVCISILHSGDDQTGYESRSERWAPVQSVQTIMLSVMSMLAEPNAESPANIDAAKMWREDRAAFKVKVHANVRQSLGL